MIANATNPYKDLSLVALCLMPLFLNDFVYLYQPSARLWLITDWGSKILSGGLVLLFVTTRHLALTPEARGFTYIEGMAVTLMAMATWWISLELVPWADALIPAAAQFTFTTYPSPSVRVIDLGLGLLLTAVVEEVLFRKVVFLALRRTRIGIVISGGLTVALFALCHWSLGLGSCLSALLFGLGAQAIFIQTGRLLPLVAAHWAYDFFWFV
jgi:hypothetical protein